MMEELQSLYIMADGPQSWQRSTEFNQATHTHTQMFGRYITSIRAIKANLLAQSPESWTVLHQALNACHALYRIGYHLQWFKIVSVRSAHILPSLSEGDIRNSYQSQSHCYILSPWWQHIGKQIKTPVSILSGNTAIKDSKKRFSVTTHSIWFIFFLFIIYLVAESSSVCAISPWCRRPKCGACSM